MPVRQIRLVAPLCKSALGETDHGSSNLSTGTNEQRKFMGNHEWPCEVCGNNKFGLGGCDEVCHNEKDLLEAKCRREKQGRGTKFIDEALELKRFIASRKH
jgi:hypothetical protein